MTVTTTSGAASDVAAVRRPRRLRAAWLLALLGVLVVVMVLSLTIGSRSVSIDDVLAALGGATDGFDRASVAKRIPRTLLAVAAGAALAVAGAVMQGVTRNPLADPGILGVTTGASLAVVTGLAFFGLMMGLELVRGILRAVYDRPESLLVSLRANMHAVGNALFGIKERAYDIPWTQPALLLVLVCLACLAILRSHAANCHFKAWLRFARAPVLAGGVASDARFSRGTGGNFTDFTPAAFDDVPCAPNVPLWDLPRQDLLDAAP